MANFSEADATKPTNPNEIPRIPKDLKLISGDDTFSISSSGQYSVVGGRGVNTLKIDYSKIPVNYGIRNSSELPNNPAFTNKARSGSFYTSEKPPSQKSGGNLVTFSGIHKFNITGTKFDDHLRGAEYKDTLVGGAGNDILYAYPGEGDILDGGDGIDLLAADYSLKADRTPETRDQKISNTGRSRLPNGTTITRIEVFSITTGRGNDTITLTGNYNDYISTGIGNDTISAGGGNDKLYGGDGNDKINSGFGKDDVSGGAGTDILVVNYSTAQYGIRSSHSLRTGTGTIYSSPTGQKTDATNSVTYLGIEQLNVIGTSLADELYSGKFSDTLNGGAGNDTLYAYPGEADRLDGGSDTVNGLIRASVNSTTLDSSSETDLLIADFSSVNQSQSIFNEDTCTLSNGTTITNIEAFYLKTGSKDDNIDLTGDYDDVISTGSGNNRISTGGGNDKLDGGKDKDILIGGNGNDYLDGGSGNDTLIGVNPQAGLPGQGEIDTLIGGIGTDRYSLGAGGAGGKVYYLGNSGTVPALTEITVDQIIAIMPSANRKLVEKYIAPLNQAMKEFNITTAVRQQAFLAQIAVETGEFKDLIELGNKDNPGRGVLQLTETSPNSATGYTNYEFIGDYVEEVISGKDIVVKQVVHKNEKNVKIVDNIKTVDGQEVGKTLGDKVRANPNLILEDPLLGCRMSAAYFDLWGCNQLADQSITDKKTDKGEFYQISQIINLGPNDKKVPLAADKRYDYFKKAQGIIKVPAWSYLYDTDYAIIENFDPLQDKIVVSGESKYSKDLGQVGKVGISDKSGQFANYDLVKNQIMLGSNSANPIFNGKTKTVSIAYDLDGSGGLSDADDIIAVITGTDNFGVGRENKGILDAITFA